MTALDAAFVLFFLSCPLWFALGFIACVMFSVDRTEPWGRGRKILLYVALAMTAPLVLQLFAMALT